MNLILDHIKNKISLLYPYCRFDSIYIYNKPLGLPSVAIYMLDNSIFILNGTEMVENLKRSISSLPMSHGTEFILSDPNCFDDVIKLIKSILDEKV